MVAKFDLNDDNVVVVIGTGAGGGVLSNELAQKGVKVVALEAGGRYLPEDYVIVLSCRSCCGSNAVLLV